MLHHRKELRCLPRERFFSCSNSSSFPAARSSSFNELSEWPASVFAHRNRISAPLSNPTRLQCRRSLPLLSGRGAQIHSCRRAGWLGCGPNRLRENVSLTQAETTGICPAADPCARRPWFAKNKKRSFASNPVHQEESNRADGQSYRLAANTSRTIEQVRLQPLAHL